MGTSMHPAGRIAIFAAGIITLVMIVYYIATKDGTLAFGMSVISIAIATFITLFYARMNSVQRTGFMALTFVIFIALLLPFFMLSQAQANADRNAKQYDGRLQHAAQLFGTYCASCHGLLGQGINGPPLNGNKTLDNFTADDLRRIITGGIPDSTNPLVYLMPQWGQTYGGPFNDDDIVALVSMIQSSSEVARGKIGAPSSVNGFDYVYQYLTADQKIDYEKQKAAAGAPKDSPIDLTAETEVTIPIVTDGATWQFWYTDKSSGTVSRVVKIKAGTVVHWVNQSTTPHSIVSGTPSVQTTTFDDPLISPNGTFDFTFATAGTYDYFCSFHPAMVAQVIVVP